MLSLGQLIKIYNASPNVYDEGLLRNESEYTCKYFKGQNGQAGILNPGRHAVPVVEGMMIDISYQGDES